jgi:hypothetical protein
MVVEFLLPIAWLVVVSFALGFALTREKSLVTIGFGLAVFAVLCIVFTLLHIPMNWFLFLALALIVLAWFVYKNELVLPKKFEMPNKTLIIVFLMALINIYVYYVGATSYPWLEDDDPWLHAMGTDWVTHTGSYSRYFDGANLTRMYIEPYPPSYDNLMGVIHQMTVSVSDTLKFFNAFLIGTTLVMAFYSIEAMTKDRRLALFSTFFLLCLPAFMGHFIWAQTLAMLFLFVALYGLEKVVSAGDNAEKNRFVLASGFAIGAIPITQPSTAAIFILFAVVYIASVLFESNGKNIAKTLKPFIVAGLIGIIIAAVYYVPVVMKYGPKYTADGIGMFQGIFTPGATDDTSGGVIYSIEDIVLVQNQGKIDQQIGIGLVLSILAIMGFVLSINELRLGKKDAWLVFASVMLIIGILGIEGNTVPVKLFPHRFWVFLAIPVAILGAYAYLWIEKKFASHKTILLALLIIGVYLTSAAGKIAVQNSQWPPGVMFGSQEEITGYLAMKTSLPPGTKVFSLCSDDRKIIGMDMESEPYVPDYEIFKRTALNRSVQEVHDFMVARGYTLMTIDSGCVQSIGIDKTNALANAYLGSSLFEKAFSNQGMLILKTK